MDELNEGYPMAPKVAAGAAPEVPLPQVLLIHGDSQFDDLQNLLLGTPEVQVAQCTTLQGGWVDGQHILVCQLVIHKMQSQMRIHGLHQVLHTQTSSLLRASSALQTLGGLCMLGCFRAYMQPGLQMPQANM